VREGKEGSRRCWGELRLSFLETSPPKSSSTSWGYNRGSFDKEEAVGQGAQSMVYSWLPDGAFWAPKKGERRLKNTQKLDVSYPSSSKGFCLKIR